MHALNTLKSLILLSSLPVAFPPTVVEEQIENEEEEEVKKKKTSDGGQTVTDLNWKSEQHKSAAG